MWPPYRNSLIEELDFYVAQANKRLLNQFDNMSEEAEAHANDVYEAMGAFFDPDRHDPGDFAETANDHGIQFYGLLDDMRKQTIVSVAAGMYHQFEIKLRDFLVKEFQKSFRADKLRQKLWRQDISRIFDVVEGCGWKVRDQPFFPVIDACRLVVNVFKHGDGPSLDELKLKYPRYLRSIYGEDEIEKIWRYIDYTHLTVELEDIGKFHAAFRDFWNSIPEYTNASQAVDVPEWFANALKG